MKYLVIVGDGMGDLPIPELNNLTPLEKAKTPNLDKISQKGSVGLMKTIFPNLPVGSIVGNMGIMGFNPYEFYPHGRASFEALAQGITLNEGDIAFRCNLISLEGEKIRDFTAESIDDGDALSMLTHLKIQQNEFEIEIYPGMSYRNLLIVRNAGIEADEVTCFEPHMNIGEEIHDILPHGRTKQSRQIIPILRNLLIDSISQFKELNKRYKTKADMIWLWSPSSHPVMPDIFDTYKITGGIVCGMDFLKGIGLAAGMRTIHIPGANAYINTNYKGKRETAINFFEKDDLVYVHVNGPDEEGHKKNPTGKVKAIELLDQEIIGPIYEHCNEKFGEEFRVMILPDHYTLCKDGKHTNHDIPVVIAGKGIATNKAQRLTEEQAEKSGSHFGRSYNFMQKFLHQKEINE